MRNDAARPEPTSGPAPQAPAAPAVTPQPQPQPQTKPESEKKDDEEVEAIPPVLQGGPEDYQLARAFDLLRGISLYKARTAN